MVWETFMKNPEARRGMERAGFKADTSQSPQSVRTHPISGGLGDHAIFSRSGTAFHMQREVFRVRDAEGHCATSILNPPEQVGKSGSGRSAIFRR